MKVKSKMVQEVKREIRTKGLRKLNLKSIGINSQNVLTIILKDNFGEEFLLNFNGEERDNLENFIIKHSDKLKTTI